MSGIRILVVEDEFLIGIELCGKLKHAGFEVVGPVATGLKAIELFRDGNFHFVIMDIRLQGQMDGIEAAKTMSAIRPFGLVFASGYESNREYLKRTEGFRMLGWLSKPLDIADLLRLIELPDPA